jgi:hypothetical protein
VWNVIRRYIIHLPESKGDILSYATMANLKFWEYLLLDPTNLSGLNLHWNDPLMK